MGSRPPDEVICPECGRATTMGLPRSAAIEAVTTTPDEELDESFLADARHKRRENACAEGHTLYVYFSF